jgi:hypothetical protein
MSFVPTLLERGLGDRALVTAGFSLLGALTVLLAHQRAAEPEPSPRTRALRAASSPGGQDRETALRQSAATATSPSRFRIDLFNSKGRGVHD